ncbi:MAG: hypothetical protein Q9222_005120 [Ikaeria aurantiellina]
MPRMSRAATPPPTPPPIAAALLDLLEDEVEGLLVVIAAGAVTGPGAAEEVMMEVRRMMLVWPFWDWVEVPIEVVVVGDGGETMLIWVDVGALLGGEGLDVAVICLIAADVVDITVVVAAVLVSVIGTLLNSLSPEVGIIYWTSV